MGSASSEMPGLSSHRWSSDPSEGLLLAEVAFHMIGKHTCHHLHADRKLQGRVEPVILVCVQIQDDVRLAVFSPKS